jgi:opacity protein-like surface antigen
LRRHVLPDDPRMRRTLALLPLMCTALALEPAGTTPLLAQVGGTYLNPELRTALDTDWGYSVGLATLIAESGIAGVPSLDIDARYVPDGTGSLTTFEATYAERALVGDRYWLGLGVGSNFVRLKLDQTAKRTERSERRWDFGGKAMFGYLLTDRLFIEATYHYTRKALDMDTASTTLGIGYWF